MYLTFWYVFSWRSEPRKASTFQPGLFAPPHLRLATNPPLRTPRLIREQVRGQCALPSSRQDVPLAFHISRAECKARLVAPAVANPDSLHLSVAEILKTIKMRRDRPLAPFLIKNPQFGPLWLVGVRVCRSILTKRHLECEFHYGFLFHGANFLFKLGVERAP